MKGPVTVAAAIRAGKKQVNGPVALIMCAVGALCFVVLPRSFWILAAMPVAFVVGWIWWLIVVRRWWRWAIANGVNADQLQQEAEDARLVWPRQSAIYRRLGWLARHDAPGQVSTTPAPPRVRPVPRAAAETPSTQRLLRLGIGKAVGFVVVWAILNPLVFHGPMDLPEAAAIGCILALVDVARLYRRAEWRAAVAPEHVLGMAGVALAVLVSDVMIARPGFSWLGVGGMALFAALPVYLLVLSGREMWRRRAIRDL